MGMYGLLYMLTQHFDREYIKPYHILFKSEYRGL